MIEQPYKWMTLKNDKIIIEVKVVPNSSKNSISVEEDFLKIKLTAAPVDNKANKALIDYLSKLFKISKTSIILLSGATSKHKKIELPKSVYEILSEQTCIKKFLS